MSSDCHRYYGMLVWGNQRSRTTHFACSASSHVCTLTALHSITCTNAFTDWSIDRLVDWKSKIWPYLKNRKIVYQFLNRKKKKCDTFRLRMQSQKLKKLKKTRKWQKNNVLFGRSNRIYIGIHKYAWNEEILHLCLNCYSHLIEILDRFLQLFNIFNFANFNK